MKLNFASVSTGKRDERKPKFAGAAVLVAGLALLGSSARADEGKKPNCLAINHYQGMGDAGRILIRGTQVCDNNDDKIPDSVAITGLDHNGFVVFTFEVEVLRVVDASFISREINSTDISQQTREEFLNLAKQAFDSKAGDQAAQARTVAVFDALYTKARTILCDVKDIACSFFI